MLARALERARGGAGAGGGAGRRAGVGKSRMAWEIAHSPRTADWLVLEAECVSHGSASLYLPIIDLLRRYVGIEAADDDHADPREDGLEALHARSGARSRAFPPLLALLDVPVEDGDWQRLDPSQRRRRIHEAVKWAAPARGRERPLLMVFEDLHWIDEETQALLDDLVNSLATARVVLLVTYRPEYGHEWGRKTYYDQIRIDPLQETSARGPAGQPAGRRPLGGAAERTARGLDRGQPPVPRRERPRAGRAAGAGRGRGAYRLPGAGRRASRSSHGARGAGIPHRSPVGRR